MFDGEPCSMLLKARTENWLRLIGRDSSSPHLYNSRISSAINKPKIQYIPATPTVFQAGVGHTSAGPAPAPIPFQMLFAIAFAATSRQYGIPCTIMQLAGEGAMGLAASNLRGYLTVLSALLDQVTCG